MAALMTCPACGEVLAELGDMDKGKNRNFYRVYDSVGNLLEDDGDHRVIECLACKYFCPLDC